MSHLIPPFRVKWGTGTLSTEREFAFPDKAGTFALLDDIPTLSSTIGYTLQAGATSSNPNNATTYFLGAVSMVTLALSVTEGLARIYIPKAGTIKAAYAAFSQTAGTGETSTISIRLNNTTDTTISSAVANNAAQTVFSKTDLSIAVAVGDYIEVKWVTPSWATPPTAVRPNIVIYIE